MVSYSGPIPPGPPIRLVPGHPVVFFPDLRPHSPRSRARADRPLGKPSCRQSALRVCGRKPSHWQSSSSASFQDSLDAGIFKPRETSFPPLSPGHRNPPVTVTVTCQGHRFASKSSGHRQLFPVKAGCRPQPASPSATARLPPSGTWVIKSRDTLIVL